MKGSFLKEVRSFIRRVKSNKKEYSRWKTTVKYRGSFTDLGVRQYGSSWGCGGPGGGRRTSVQGFEDDSGSKWRVLRFFSINSTLGHVLLLSTEGQNFNNC